MFTGEDVAERVADEVGVAYHQIGLMMSVAIYPRIDSAVGEPSSVAKATFSGSLE